MKKPFIALTISILATLSLMTPLLALTHEDIHVIMRDRESRKEVALISEIHPSSSASEKSYIEVFNNSQSDVDLSSLYIILNCDEFDPLLRPDICPALDSTNFSVDLWSLDFPIIGSGILKPSEHFVYYPPAPLYIPRGTFLQIQYYYSDPRIPDGQGAYGCDAPAGLSCHRPTVKENYPAWLIDEPSENCSFRRYFFEPDEDVICTVKPAETIAAPVTPQEPVSEPESEDTPLPHVESTAANQSNIAPDTFLRSLFEHVTPNGSSASNRVAATSTISDGDGSAKSTDKTTALSSIISSYHAAPTFLLWLLLPLLLSALFFFLILLLKKRKNKKEDEDASKIALLSLCGESIDFSADEI